MLYEYLKKKHVNCDMKAEGENWKYLEINY